MPYKDPAARLFRVGAVRGLLLLEIADARERRALQARAADERAIDVGARLPGEHATVGTSGG